MTFEKAIEKIFEGNCILFTGSGFSFGAQNVLPSDSEIKSAPDLAELLYKDSGYGSSNTDLKKAATAYLKKKSVHELIDILKKEFTISKISSDHEYIGSLKWSRIYTTNYDAIIETAYKQNRTGEYLTPVTLSNHPNNYPNKDKVAVHLNGYIDNLTADTLNSEFRLINRSYLTDDFEKSKWIEIFKGDIKACDAIFFVGFSLDYDLDIARIIHNSDIKDKAYFIVWDKEDEINRETMRDFGDVQAVSLSGFVQKIKDIKKNYTPSAIKIFNPLCFSQPTLNRTLPNIRDIDFYNLLLMGDLNEHILYHSLLDPLKYKYFSLRESLIQVTNDIKEGAGNFLVEGGLGNGKTLFLRALSILLTREGYKVFFFEKYRACIESEIQKICDDYDNAVLIFDDYHTIKEHIAFFSLRRKNQILITSERIHLHEVIFDEIEDVIGEYKTINIDFLTDEELKSFDDYLSNYSLWKEFTTKPAERIKYMSTTCKRQICNIILSRIKSPDLSKRIQNIIVDIKKKDEFYTALIVILISESFRFRLELGELVETLGSPALNNPSFKKNASIREFINFEQNQITFKSPILSQYILSNIIQPELVIDSLILLANNLDNKYDVNKQSKEKLISIINFRTIQKSININDPAWKREIFRFYETIKEYNFCKNNIHFWLQYAIARLSDYNYEIAEAYFEKCYELAKTIRGYDTYKIDNHYCRFILENEIENGNKATCMEAFEYAHSILINTRKGEEKKHYPFRVAGQYERFYKKYFASLEAHHRKKFLTACDEMLKKCEKYLRIIGVTNVKYVHDTKRKLEDILQQEKS
jgi:mRNA-degrading endonuclease YafQ of YafQ-DinJ toxin-antitoxin module